MMGSEFHIAVSCNERYVPGALVALAGVAVHARPETPLRFHVFTEGVGDESVEFMRTTLGRLHPNCELERHVCDEGLLRGLPRWAGSRMSFARCFHPRLLPEVDWCLYLDCDVLYLGSVEEHFSYRREDALAVVVVDEHESCRRADARWAAETCGVELKESDYFNAGVMLFNFRKCREEGVPEKLAAFIAEHPHLPYADQSALNVVLRGQVAFAPPKFDRLQIYLTDGKMAERPVVHYVCGNPWIPKYGVVMNNRFRLWHAFADKYVWQRRGESCRRLFTRKMLAVKRIENCLLESRLLGPLFAWCAERMGWTGDGREWRRFQTAFDIGGDPCAYL